MESVVVREILDSRIEKLDMQDLENQKTSLYDYNV